MSSGSKATITILFAAAMSGCAPTNPESLRNDPGRSSSFETPLPYTTVYENVQQGFLRCMTGSYYQMSFSIKPRMDRARKTATVTYVHHGAWKDFWAAVDIQAKGKGTTVQAYATGHAMMSGFETVVEQWASGNPECPEFSPVMRHFPLTE